MYSYLYLFIMFIIVIYNNLFTLFIFIFILFINFLPSLMKKSRLLKHVIVTPADFFSWNTSNKEESQSEGLLGKEFQPGIEFQVVTALPSLAQMASVFMQCTPRSSEWNAVLNGFMRSKWLQRKVRNPLVTQQAPQEVNPEKSSCYCC